MVEVNTTDALEAPVQTQTVQTQTVQIQPMQTPSTAVDMLTPTQVCVELGLDEVGLLDLVNHGHLAAYDLGGNIRFRARDVVASLALLAVA